MKASKPAEDDGQPTVSPLPPGAVIVTEHKEPHAMICRSIAQNLGSLGITYLSNPQREQFAKELRAAADYVERLEHERDELAGIADGYAEGTLSACRRVDAETARAEQAEQEAQTLREERDRLRKALENVRLRAARGRNAGHMATRLTHERMIEKKDEALDGVISYCADVGVVGSLLR